MAGTMGFPSVGLQAVAREDTPPSEGERAMMAYARKIARDANQVTVGDVAMLKARGFSGAESFEIAAIAAARSFLTKVMDALGVQPDSSFLEMDETFQHSMTMGRPIDPGQTGKVALATEQP